MKDISNYLESILDGFLPSSEVRVEYRNEFYIIMVDLFNVANLKKPGKEKTLRGLVEEMIESELKTYFEKAPKHFNTIRFYEHSNNLC